MSLLGIFVYIVVYNIYLKEGYAEFATDGQSVLFKPLRGSMRPNFTNKQLNRVPEDHLHLYNRVWDTADDLNSYGPTSFFVATNLIITPNQTRGTCPDYPSTSTSCDPADKTSCSLADYVPLVPPAPPVSGVWTGNCVHYNHSDHRDNPDHWDHDNKSDHRSNYDHSKNFTCEYLGWCPPQRDLPPSDKMAIFNESRNFTVQLQNSVYFTKFKLFLDNDKEKCNKVFWNATDKSTKHSRNFRIEDIVNMAHRRERENGREASFDDLAMEGAVIKIAMKWRCFLGLREDWLKPLGWSEEWVKRNCLHTTDAFLLKRGFYNTNKYYYPVETKEGGSQYYRNLYKVFGINFKIEVSYHVTKFSLINVVKLLVAGAGLVATSEFLFWLMFSGCGAKCARGWCCSTVHTINSQEYKDMHRATCPESKVTRRLFYTTSKKNIFETIDFNNFSE